MIGWSLSVVYSLCVCARNHTREAAAKVQEAIFAKHLEGYRAPPRLFLLECDVSAEHKAICEQHTDHT